MAEELNGAGEVEWDDSSLAPPRELQDQEKQLLLSFKPVMQKFLHDHTNLQVSALYALQVHCHTAGFPKGKHTHTHTLSMCERQHLFVFGPQ